MDRRRFLQASTALSVAGEALLGSAIAKADGFDEPRSQRQTLSLDGDWRFIEAELPFVRPSGQEASYADGKAGNASGAAAVDYDDTGWGVVDLPHDFALAQPPRAQDNLSQGFRRRGVGWYRRTFRLDAEDRDRHLELQFDGVATAATVWLNGDLLHRSFSAYTGFNLDITAQALFEDDLNTLVVRADANPIEGWWYEGAGIYRHVRLVTRARRHIVTDGLSCQPSLDDDTRWRAGVGATVRVMDLAPNAAPAMLVAQMFDPDGRSAGVASTPLPAGATGLHEVQIPLAVERPLLWSPDRPALYRLQVQLVERDVVLDAATTTVGLRTLAFDPAAGFQLNGAPLKIKGTCVHQDLAGVGVAVPDSLWSFRVERLKAMGANAVRCAHNPPAREFLDACDRLGLMVLDEVRHFGVGEDALDQLRFMVRRDRNHPSVILWGIANEESIQGSAHAYRIGKRMVDEIKTLDASRPVTAAMNGGWMAKGGLADALDVVGFNYGYADYDAFHAAHPTRPMISSEDGSAYSMRGILKTDVQAHLVPDSDEGPDHHGEYAQGQREDWRSIATRPFVAGGFVWTGFDYRGEPSPYDWPTVSSSFGVMDLCGFPKAAFHIRRALWTRTEPVLTLTPHWTWPGLEGTPIRVMAATNLERVVILLNGREAGSGPVDPFMLASFDIPYAPGRLEAFGYRGDQLLAHTVVETAGEPVAVRLTPWRRTLAGDGLDAQPVTVEVVDAEGRPVPTADRPIVFSAEGLTILGVGNGDPNSHAPDKALRRALFNGLAQATVQATRGVGSARLSAASPGLRSAELVMALKPARPPASAPSAPSVQSLTEWRQSPASDRRPDPRQKLVDGDMNTWGWSKPGSALPPSPNGRYTLFRVVFTPWSALQRQGGRILFSRLAGRAEIWLDGIKVAEKPDAAAGPFAIPLPPSAGERTLAVLFDAPVGSGPFGILGMVRAERTPTGVA